jgi:site-specific DNA-methyltransferase (adenine-specific)
MVNKALFASNSAEWETPQNLFDQLNKEFNFQIDVCATQDNTKCPVFFNKETNGLIMPWFNWSTCWLNPPYGKEIGLWIEKAHKEARQGATVVCLLPSRTDTKYFHDFIWDKEKYKPREGVEIRFLKGRLKFGGSKNSAPFPSMIVIFRTP